MLEWVIGLIMGAEAALRSVLLNGGPPGLDGATWTVDAPKRPASGARPSTEGPPTSTAATSPAPSDAALVTTPSEPFWS